MRALIAGGGTGGHIYPAIAVAEKIVRKQPASEILFIGAKQGMEKDLAPQYGFPIRLIDVKGFSRKNLLKNIGVVSDLLRSIRQIKEIIEEFKPDVAIGSGGYVSGPVIRTAAKSGVNTFIMEQNAWPGLANLMAEKYVKKTFIAFEEGKKHFKFQDKIVVSGNPIRKEFYTVKLFDYRSRLGVKDNEFAVLCFGGSLGAKTICETFSDILVNLSKEYNIKIFFVTGSFYFNDVIEKLQVNNVSFRVIKPMDDATNPGTEAGIANGSNADTNRVIKPAADAGTATYNIDSNAEERVYVMEYAKNLHEYMAAADLIVSRSGALTISEIAVCGKASILIPSPNVTGNHQYYNACTLADRGAANIILEKDLTPMKLLDTILRLKNNKRRINEMAEAGAEIGRLDAADIIYDHISAVCRG